MLRGAAPRCSSAAFASAIAPARPPTPLGGAWCTGASFLNFRGFSRSMLSLSWSAVCVYIVFWFACARFDCLQLFWYDESFI